MTTRETLSNPSVEPRILKLPSHRHLCPSCMLTVSILNSEEYRKKLPLTMRCCKEAPNFYNLLLSVAGIDSFRFEGGHVFVTLLAEADEEMVLKEIKRIIDHHPIL